MAGQNHPSHTLADKLFSRLRSLKANNLHGECYQAAAQALGLSELAQQFERINGIQDREGHLPHDVYHERHRAYQQLLQSARSRLSIEQYNKLYMCF